MAQTTIFPLQYSEEETHIHKEMHNTSEMNNEKQKKTHTNVKKDSQKVWWDLCSNGNNLQGWKSMESGLKLIKTLPFSFFYGMPLIYLFFA